MQLWQEGLVALAVLWACQGVGTWAQMRHYGRVMAGVSQRWPDGYVGASAARGTFGRGVVALIVASPDRRVRQLFLMEGRSVFAAFRECPEAAGLALDALPGSGFVTSHKGRAKAVTGAAKQIDTAIDRADHDRADHDRADHDRAENDRAANPAPAIGDGRGPAVPLAA